MAINLQQTLDLAVQHHQSGRLAQAEALYRQILAHDPNHGQAVHLLGLVAFQAGRNDVAIEWVGRAAVLRPDDPTVLGNLAKILIGAGRHDQAIDALRKAIALRPGDPESHYNLGNAMAGKREWEQAIAAFRQAIVLAPGSVEARNNLGIALAENGRLDEAITAYQKAIAINPDLPQSYNNLGNALRVKGQLEDSIAAFRRAIALQPRNAEAINNLGNALKDQGRLKEAMQVFEQAISADPRLTEAHKNLADALRDEGRLDQAVAEYQQAISLKPNYCDAFVDLGATLRELGKLEESMGACRRALAIQPDCIAACNILGNVLRDQGRLDEAATEFGRGIALATRPSRTAPKPGYETQLSAAYGNLGNVLREMGWLNEAVTACRQSVALAANWAAAHSNLLYSLQMLPKHDAAGFAEEHREWNRRHCQRLHSHFAGCSTLLQKSERDPSRRLRIGYVSPDFRSHPVGRFLIPLLENHSDAEVEVYCYSNVRRPDSRTDRIRRRASVWRNIVGLSDDAAAELIRSDRIDILVDLAGHTDGNRLLLFARKPAPVQVTFLGYPATTGMTAIDYRLTDALADPPGMTESHYTEELVRLNGSAWCFDPPADAPAPGQPPCLGNGFVTFGSFNNFAKTNAPLLKCWARILSNVPQSRLLLKSSALDCPPVQSAVRKILAEEGISGDRLMFRGRSSSQEHLASYGLMDIALDTFPYHGTTTTCEALWMGVPVITRAGQSHVSRVGVSLLAHVGLSEMIAATEEDYLRIAVELAGDPNRLKEMRASLRQRMANSSLTDGASFARSVESAYRMMWRRWCG